MAKVPAERRKVITTHDAFGYFGRAYGVTFLAPIGVSTEAEPSPAAVARLAAQRPAAPARPLYLRAPDAKLPGGRELGGRDLVP